ncbi:MAG: tetratricopeptide repeat protein [SAR324 cluster bacterium]
MSTRALHAVAAGAALALMAPGLWAQPVGDPARPAASPRNPASLPLTAQNAPVPRRIAPAPPAARALAPAPQASTEKSQPAVPIATLTGLQLRRDGNELTLQFLMTRGAHVDAVANLPRRVIVVKFTGARAAFPDGQRDFAFNDPLVVGVRFDAIDDATTWAQVRLRVPDVLYQVIPDPAGGRPALTLRPSPEPVGTELSAVRSGPAPGGGTRVVLDFNRTPPGVEDRADKSQYVLRLKGTQPRLAKAPRIDDEQVSLAGTEKEGGDTILRFQLKGPTRVTSTLLQNPPRLVLNLRPSQAAVAGSAAPGMAGPQAGGGKRESLEALLNDEPSQNVRGNYQEGERAMQAGNAARAQTLFEAIYASAPTRKLGIRSLFRAADAHFERLQAAGATNYSVVVLEYQAAIRAADEANYESDQIPRAFYQIGRSYNLMGFYGESNTYFQILLERFPSAVPYVTDAHFYMGHNFTALTQLEDAIANFRKFVDAGGDPKLNAAARYELGDALYTEGRYVEARAEFDAGRREDPEYANALPLLLFHAGETYYENAEYDLARGMYQQLLRHYPDRVYSKLVGLRLGDLLRDEGKSAEALATYEQVMQGAPLNIALRAKMRVANLLAERPSGDDWKRSLPLYDEAIATGGTGLLVQEALLRKALTLTLHNQHREAIDAFETLVHTYPDSPFARDNLVKAHVEENLKSLADQLFQKRDYWGVVRLYSQYEGTYFHKFPFPMTLFQAARSYQRLGLYDPAIAIYDDLLPPRGDPGGLRSLIEYERASALGDKDDLGAASGALQAFITAHPHDTYTTDARMRLGQVFFNGRQYDEAQRTYRALIQDIEKANAGDLVDAAPEAFYREGLIAKELGQNSEALENFRQVAARYNYPLTGEDVPDFVIRSQFATGDLLFEQGQNPAAIAAYEQAVARYPDHERAPWARYQMGLLYRRMGDDKHALEIFNGLVDLAKSHPGEMWEALARENQRDLSDKLQYQDYLRQ